MTRLILFADARRLEGLALDAEDWLLPLNDAAADDLAARGLAARLIDLPDLGALQTDSLSLAFETAQAILAALGGDLAWDRLLHYRDYDLRVMALKNLFFALEDAARIYRMAAAAAAAFPNARAVLLEFNPAVRRAVCAALPAAAGGLRTRPYWHIAREWSLPLARYARDRWRSVRATRPEAVQGRPVVFFLDAPHRAQIMARTLALLAADHPVYCARLEGDWAWPAGLPVVPALEFDWDAWRPLGASVRIARHVLGSLARTDPGMLDSLGATWIPARMLWNLRYNDVQRYAAMIEALDGLARAVRPALWITLEDLFAFGKCVAAVGERLGVPTLNVQHGIIGAYPYRTGVDVVGTFAAFGESSRQTLIARGADPARIVVTGPVRYDDIHDPARQPDRSALLRAAGLDPARPVVLFASQPARRLITTGIRRAALRALLGAAGEIGAQVVIKPHPLEDDTVATEVLAEVGHAAPVVRGELYDWLAVCEVMATVSSTVVYEAALAERPALVLEWSGNPDVAGYLAEGIALLPESPDRVAEALRRLITDEPTRAAMRDRQRAFAADHLAGNDGRASERLATLARRLMGEA